METEPEVLKKITKITRTTEIEKEVTTEITTEKEETFQSKRRKKLFSDLYEKKLQIQDEMIS